MLGFQPPPNCCHLALLLSVAVLRLSTPMRLFVLLLLGHCALRGFPGPGQAALLPLSHPNPENKGFADGPVCAARSPSMEEAWQRAVTEKGEAAGWVAKKGFWATVLLPACVGHHFPQQSLRAQMSVEEELPAGVQPNGAGKRWAEGQEGAGIQG